VKRRKSTHKDAMGGCREHDSYRRKDWRSREEYDTIPGTAGLSEKKFGLGGSWKRPTSKEVRTGCEIKGPTDVVAEAAEVLLER